MTIASENLIPGSGVLGRGFDIFGSYTNPTLKSSLFDMISSGRTDHVSGQDFDIPNNVGVNKAQSKVVGSAYYFESREKYQTHLQEKAHVEGSYGAFSGDASARYDEDFSSETEFHLTVVEGIFANFSIFLNDFTFNALSSVVKDDPTLKQLCNLNAPF